MKHVTKTIFLIFLSFSSFGLFAQIGTGDITIDTLASRPETYSLQTHDPAIEIEYSSGKIYYGGLKGLYVSTDGGKTWTHSNFTVNSKNVGITSLEVDQNTGTLYAGYNYTGGFGSSVDGGKTWTIHTTISCTYIAEIDGDIYFNNFKLPGGNYLKRTIVSGGSGVVKGPDGNLYSFLKSRGEIFQSLDTGKTWVQKYNSKDDVDYLYATDDDIYYSDEKLGVFKTDSSFKKSVKVLGPTTGNVMHNGKGFLIITRWNDQISFSDDNGKTFLHTNNTSMKTIFGDIPVPNMDPEEVVDQLDTYKDKIYLADATGLIYTMSLGGSTSLDGEGNKQVQAYPNPAKENITFQVSGIKEIKVVNILGEAMETQRTNNQLNTSNYPKGIYFATIFTPSGIWRSKFIVD